MTPKLGTSPLRARLGAASLTALLGLASLVVLPASHAALPDLDPSAVVTGDTFSIDMVGYNTTTPSGDIYIIQTGLTPAFGGTTTYAADALNSQTLTVTSSETTSGTRTTDTITVSVPTNFVPAGFVDNNGNTINAIEFAIGTDLGGTNTLDYTVALPSYTTYSGSVSGTSLVTTSLAGGQNPLLTNSNKSLSNEEAIAAFTGSTPTAISAYGINTFTFTIAVPEPSTYATVILGAVSLFWVTSRRHRARA